MTLAFDGDQLHLSEQLGVEDAETLLVWLVDHPNAQAHFEQLTHLHGACLQVLLLMRPAVASWPEDPDLSAWLKAALVSEEN